MDELIRSKSRNIRTDLIILDFSKAFDKVSHAHLVNKLSHYGVRGKTDNWISSFLSNRSQAVVVDGSVSDSCNVTSGVPQGSVLGPILFLAYLHDLPDCVNSNVRLFADDCILYRQIKSATDCNTLQKDLDALNILDRNWLTEFNADKCHYMMIAPKSASPYN